MSDSSATVADQKWDLVKPEIFGTLFQSSMDADERHAFGAHFTSEFDIQKVVGPTIVRPWRARMAVAWDNMDDLTKVLTALRAFRVLDPACGSGNFLAVAYREMKRLEQDILNLMRELSTFSKVKGSKVGKSVPPKATKGDNSNSSKSSLVIGIPSMFQGWIFLRIPLTHNQVQPS